ncbi:MAG: hypothetical protein NVSMB67_25160 [Flavisolibacter sp.]
MKPYFITLVGFTLFCLLSTNKASSQVCSNPSGVIYGLSPSGGIYPITVSNGSVGAPINTPFGTPTLSDAMGYNALDGKFYYFNKSGSPNEFISYNPVLNSYTLLTPCPAT